MSQFFFVPLQRKKRYIIEIMRKTEISFTTKVVENYCGYGIAEVIRNCHKEKTKGVFEDKPFVQMQTGEYVVFVKGATGEKRSERYQDKKKDIHSCKDMINTIEQGYIFLTEQEYYDWVERPLQKHNYLNKGQLMALAKKYKAANDRRKIAYRLYLRELCLTKEAIALMKEDYDKFKEYASVYE